VFALYWVIPSHRIRDQNMVLLLASYVFYGWWDWRFLSLILFSSIIDFGVGRALDKEIRQHRRILLLLVSICVNLGFLGFFKYYNFFTEGFEDAFTFFGSSISASRLNIILPVGISFYTFQTLSYSIDIYRKKMRATKDPLAFFVFVSFFPQLVAGPIERATHLLPQFKRSRQFEYSQAADGVRQILFGLFKKVVIADNCAVYVNEIFSNHEAYGGSALFLGAFLFAFQIYGDFSGYSDIAIGTARLFGFKLMRNFAYPYFSRDIAEFWRRWHISLSTWFRDYVYIPLGGSRVSTIKMVRNTFIIFVVSGFWHGANWTFIFWGFLNALYFMPLMLLKRNRRYTSVVAEHSMFPSFREIIQISMTFFITLIAWIFFRADNIGHAFSYLEHMFQRSLFSIPMEIKPKFDLIITLCMIFILTIWEWVRRKNKHGLEIHHLATWKRYSAYVFIFGLIYFFGIFKDTQFIYFQF
jgi:D-alanyl-lipoteichoic acid acyltransferase DltB (MBOAT superfamily)